MEKSTVEKFASELNLPIDLLLKQLESAGIKNCLLYTSDAADE